VVVTKSCAKYRSLSVSQGPTIVSEEDIGAVRLTVLPAAHPAAPRVTATQHHDSETDE